MKHDEWTKKTHDEFYPNDTMIKASGRLLVSLLKQGKEVRKEIGKIMKELKEKECNDSSEV